MLDERKLKAALLRFKDVEVTKIAEEIGISRQTFYNWEDTEEFKAEVDRLGHEVLSRADNILINEQIKSIKKLAELRDNATSEKVQIDAASKLLDKKISNATKVTIDDGRDTKNIVPVDVLETEMDELDDV